MTPRNKFIVPFKLGLWAPVKQSQPSEGVSGPAEPPRSHLNWSPRSGPTAGPRGSGYEVGRDRHYPHLPKTFSPAVCCFSISKQLLFEASVFMWLASLLEAFHGLCASAGMNHAVRIVSRAIASRAHGAQLVDAGLTPSGHDGSKSPSMSDGHIFPLLDTLLMSGSSSLRFSPIIPRCHIYIGNHLVAS